MSRYYGWIMAIAEGTLHFARRTSEEKVSPRAVTHRPTAAIYAAITRLSPSFPSLATRIISRLHSALFLQAPRSTSEERELHCTLPHIPWNNKRGASAALLFVLSSKWAACAMCVDVHTLRRPAPKVGRRLSSREGWSEERGSFFGLAVCAILPPASCLFFDSWRRSFVFVESGSGRRRRRFRFRGEQRIIRDHELSQVAGTPRRRGSLNSAEVGRDGA